MVNPSNGNPLVSVIILSYNYGQYLGEAIDSALNQTYNPIEVIVVDDGSTDNSPEIIDSYGNRIIPIIKENKGSASSINAGFKVSKGQIICLMDSDDLFLPGKITEVVKVLNSDPEIGWFYHRMKLMDLEIDIDYGLSPERKPGKCDVRNEIRRGRLTVGAPATSALCFTRGLFDQILPLPIHKFYKVGDKYYKELAFALSKGYFCNEPLSILRIHAKNDYSGLPVEEKLPKLALRHLNSAYWMRKKWPQFNRYSNKMFAKGMGIFQRIGGIAPEYRALIDEYQSSTNFIEDIQIFLLTNAYRYLWNPYKNVRTM